MSLITADDALALGWSMVGSAVTLILKALEGRGRTKAEARADLLEFVEDMVAADESLEAVQLERQRRLDARIPPP